MHNISLRSSLSLCSLALLLAGCGGGTPAKDVQINPNGTVKVTTSEGTAQTGGSVPADWPSDAPVYPGATVAFSASTNPATGTAGFGLMLTTDASADDVAAFYKKELTVQGWTIDADMNAGVTTVISAKKDARAIGISITGSEGMTSITIGIDLGEDQ